jgi:hypothetical protein
VTKKQWYKDHESPLKGRKWAPEIIEKRRQSLLEYYKTHEIWNLGLSIHDDAARKRISDRCKSNGVGKWNAGRRENYNNKKKGDQ